MRPCFLSTPLRYFLAVAQHGSVHGAAQHLHVAASAVSRQLGRLEDGLGLLLFERQHRGMRLTPAGVELAGQLGAAAESMERLIEQVQGSALQHRQMVRVACTEGFAAGFMPGVLNTFGQQHPQVQLQLTVTSPQEVSALLLRGHADIGLKYCLAPERGLKAHLSCVATAQAVMRPKHPLARRTWLRITDVVKYPLVLATPGNTGRDLFDLSCSLQALSYQTRVESNFSSALLSLVSGQDLLLAGRLTVAHLLDDGSLVAVPFAEGELQQRRLQLLTADKLSLTPALQALIDAVKVRIKPGRA